MLVDSDQLIQYINSSYLATLLLKLRWHTRIYEETFHVNSIQLKKRKIFEFLWLESRVYKKQQLWPLSGRYQTLIWRPGDTVQNLESPGLSGRVDSNPQGSHSHILMRGGRVRPSFIFYTKKNPNFRICLPKNSLSVFASANFIIYLLEIFLFTYRLQSQKYPVIPHKQ